MTALPYRLGLLAILLACYGVTHWVFSTVLKAESQQHNFSLEFPIEHESLNSMEEVNQIESVVVAGFFSDWRTDIPSYRLRKIGDTTWQREIPLPSGDSQYKYVVKMQDGATHWVLDPLNLDAVDDSFGSQNSVISTPNYALYHQIIDITLLSLFVGGVFYIALHAFISWLLEQKLLMRSKLVIGALSIIFVANLSFIAYQVFEMRKTIVLGIEDEIHLVHLYLHSQGVDFDDLPNSKPQLKNALHRLMWNAKTRVERKQSSLFQISLSDLAIVTPKLELVVAQNRQQNVDLQNRRKDQIGYQSIEEYYMKGVFGPAISTRSLHTTHDTSVLFSPSAEVIEIETFFTTWSRMLLGFSNILVPITEFGQTNGYYIAAVQVKMFGHEILRVILIGLLLSLLICTISFLLLFSYGKRITLQLHGMIGWVQNINKGDLTTSFEVDTRDELQTLRDELGKMQGSLYANIEHIKAQNQLLNRTAFFDHTTGLPNRTKLKEDIEHIKEKTLILVGLSDFDKLNSFLGEDYSGQLVIAVVSRVSQQLESKQQKVYRIQPGCFAVTHTSMGGLRRQAEKLCNAITHTPFLLNDIPFDMHAVASINGAINTRVSAEHIIAQTEFALQQAKPMNQQVVTYQPALDNRDQYARNVRTVALLKDAIENNKLVPFYQPIIDSNTQAIVKLEALARIQLSANEVIPPLEFIPAAIQSGLYPQLSKTIFRRSFEDLTLFKTPISINMSALDIATDQAERNILSLLEEFNDVADKVTLEITETEKIDDYEAMTVFIKKAKAFGCKIALDDFGAGYSNFAHLLALQVDYIKIDGSIVRNLDTDKDAHRICLAIVECAQALQIKTIAEYVHSEVIYTIVKEMGVNYCQGYYFGAPSRDFKTK